MPLDTSRIECIKAEYFEERTRLQKEAMQQATKQDQLFKHVMRIYREEIPAYCGKTENSKREDGEPAERCKALQDRLQNELIFFGIVNELAGCGMSDEQIAAEVNRAVGKKLVTKPDGCEEGVRGIERVSAALFALEMQERGFDLDDLLKIRLSS